jgi:hypothetical protein
MSLPSGMYPTTDLSTKLRLVYNPSAWTSRKHSSYVVCVSGEVPMWVPLSHSIGALAAAWQRLLSCFFCSLCLATGLYTTILSLFLVKCGSAWLHQFYEVLFLHLLYVLMVMHAVQWGLDSFTLLDNTSWTPASLQFYLCWLLCSNHNSILPPLKRITVIIPWICLEYFLLNILCLTLLHILYIVLTA